MSTRFGLLVFVTSLACFAQVPVLPAEEKAANETTGLSHVFDSTPTLELELSFEPNDARVGDRFSIHYTFINRSEAPVTILSYTVFGPWMLYYQRRNGQVVRTSKRALSGNVTWQMRPESTDDFLTIPAGSSETIVEPARLRRGIAISSGRLTIGARVSPVGSDFYLPINRRRRAICADYIVFPEEAEFAARQFGMELWVGKIRSNCVSLAS